MEQEQGKEPVDPMEYLLYLSSDSSQSEAYSSDSDDSSTDIDIMIEDESLVDSFRSPRYSDEDYNYDMNFPLMDLARRVPQLEIRSCINFSIGGNSPQLSARSAFSCNAAETQGHFQEGNLWKFYGPQCGYVELKRCNSETKLDIHSRQDNRGKNYSSDDDDDDDDETSSMRSYKISMMNFGEGETSYNNVTDYFYHDMNELSELFANLTISFGNSPCRVKKIFNLDTWMNAIYEMPRFPGDEPRIWPMEKAWMFVEFCPRTHRKRGKRFADWYSTEQVPEEKKRK